MNKEKIVKLAEIIKNSKNLVFFTGAGVSTESGLKSFRGKDGLYSTLYLDKYQPEQILSIDFFRKHKEIFIKYIEEKMQINNIKPNKGHQALAYLEKIGILKAVITQNIDNLHQVAGNKNVIELHGSLKRWFCENCGKRYEKNSECSCGGTVRPEVTLYGEMLNMNAVHAAIVAIEKADTLVIAGTSLTVYPAAHYIEYFKHNIPRNKLVIINKEGTQYDHHADLTINGNFAEIMKEIIKIIKKEK